MARQIYSFDVRVPANTPKTAPITSPMTIPTRVVNRIEVTVPPGPSGLVGFAIVMAGQPVIPYNPGAWVVANGEYIVWDLDDYPESGAWAVTAYNLDTVYDHTLSFRLLTSLVQLGVVLPVTPIDPAAIVAAGRGV